jgi:putative protein kinase ArgK-like GTPase of G3E family
MQVSTSGLAQKTLKGDEESAVRLISLIENGKPEGYAELSLILPHTGSAHVIGITGSSRRRGKNTERSEGNDRGYGAGHRAGGLR